MHQPTNGKAASFFFRSRYVHDRYNDPKKCKSDHNLSEKTEKKGRQVFRLLKFGGASQ